MVFRRYRMRKCVKFAAVLLVLAFLAVVLPAQDQAARREARKKARAYWQRADARRRRRKYEDAAKDYEKSVEAWRSANNRNFANVTAQMAGLCRAMPIDVRKLKDGTYTGTARGYSADITVEVQIRRGRIRGFRVTDQRESRPLKSLQALPALIGRRQSCSVDVVTGATVTSYGVMAATQRALEKAKPED